MTNTASFRSRPGIAPQGADRFVPHPRTLRRLVRRASRSTLLLIVCLCLFSFFSCTLFFLLIEMKLITYVAVYFINAPITNKCASQSDWIPHRSRAIRIPLCRFEHDLLLHRALDWKGRPGSRWCRWAHYCQLSTLFLFVYMYSTVWHRRSQT